MYQQSVIATLVDLRDAINNAATDSDNDGNKDI